MIKTIFFDIGGVLIDINFRKTSQYISDCTDLSVNQIENSFPHEEHNKYEKGLISDHEWFLAYKESLPQPCCLKESDFWRSWKILLGKETKVLNIMKKLKVNYSIWLLSNTNPKHINDEIDKKYKFPKIVDGSIYSFDIGFRKPEKEIYIRAANIVDLNPEECLFIDDLSENIEAAKKVGFLGIHFKSYSQLKNHLLDKGFL